MSFSLKNIGTCLARLNLMVFDGNQYLRGEVMKADRYKCLRKNADFIYTAGRLSYALVVRNKETTMSLYHVHMHLARSQEFPEGSRSHGYELTLPLNASMQFDAAEWKKHISDCTVRRFWDGEEPKLGRIRHYGNSWVIDYDVKSEGDEEPLFKLKDHRILQGEYLSIQEPGGESHTFLIDAVTPVPALKS